MSARGDRRQTRASSKEAPAPAATPSRQLRSNSQGREMNSGLPSLLGAASTAYGSPAPSKLARSITPRRSAASLFHDLAKTSTEVPNPTSDLDFELSQGIVPATRKTPAKRRGAATPRSVRPEPIPEASSEDTNHDMTISQVVGETTSTLNQAATPQAQPTKRHFRSTATPPVESRPRPKSQRTRRNVWHWPSKSILQSSAVSFAIGLLVLVLALPWIPYNDQGGVIQDLKYYHDSASRLIPNIFQRPEAPKEDWSAFARQLWELQQEQQQLRRQYRGYDAALSQMAKNYHDSLSQVNFFSYKLGATVDPFLSSPTRHPKQPSLLDRLITNQQRKEPNPPATALLPWDEAGDCWCTPPTTAGNSKAQLAINMPYLVIPQSITVEHHPAQGLMEAGSVPKDMQLWVPIRNQALRETIAGQTKSPNPLDNGLPEGFVRIASFTYIREPADGNHIQTFDMDYPLERFAAQGLEINKAVVRASSNYGAEYTCLYRIRLHGKAIEAPMP